VVAILPTPILARIGGRFDARWLATLSFAAFGLSNFMCAGYTTYSDFITSRRRCWSRASP
jgi:MFS transporter, DHA2 family, multidrug resistance protein